MKRRSYLKAMLAAAAGLKGAVAQGAANPIVLDVDLSVDPAREKEMLQNFRTVFKPAATKYPGYIDVKILKLRTALQGAAPAGVNYRFQLTHESGTYICSQPCNRWRLRSSAAKEHPGRVED